MTTLTISVPLIISARAHKEVIYIAARRIITVVTDMEAFSYFTFFS
jgi:hypothetical protein